MFKLECITSIRSSELDAVNIVALSWWFAVIVRARPYVSPAEHGPAPGDHFPKIAYLPSQPFEIRSHSECFRVLCLLVPGR